MSITEILIYLATPAGIGAAISLLTELYPGWDNLSKQRKTIIIVLLTIVMPLLSWSLITYVPADVWARLSPPLHVLIGGISVLITFLTSQATHAIHRR